LFYYRMLDGFGNSASEERDVQAATL